MQSQMFQRAENGDSQAQGELFRQHFPVTYRLAYSLLHHHEDAEEVAQDSLAYALMHLDAFDPERGAFTTWLYTITVSRCRNKRRRQELAEIPLMGWLFHDLEYADIGQIVGCSASTAQSRVWLGQKRLYGLLAGMAGVELFNRG